MIIIVLVINVYLILNLKIEEMKKVRASICTVNGITILLTYL